MKCIYCGIEGAHPGTRKCSNPTECDLRVTLQERDAAVSALRALIRQVARCGRGLHTGSCATVPREIIRRGMDQRLDGHDEPQYAPPGKCDCGAMVVADQVDAVLKELL